MKVPIAKDARTGLLAAETTLDRRDLLEWLGKGAVLVLGSPLVASCLTGPTGKPFVVPEEAAGDGSFPFQPADPDHEVFEGWRQRTVDPQELEAILASWRLDVGGFVESPRTYSFADLVALEPTNLLADFHCVEGWSVYDVPWNGVHLSRIFDDVRPERNATYVAFHTIGGTYNESLPLSVALEQNTILAYGIADATLPLKHGFPARIVIPRLLGYKNAKHVERIELTDEPTYGYWVRHGYPYEGEVPEDRLREGKY